VALAVAEGPASVAFRCGCRFTGVPSLWVFVRVLVIVVVGVSVATGVVGVGGCVRLQSVCRSGVVVGVSVKQGVRHRIGGRVFLCKLACRFTVLVGVLLKGRVGYCIGRRVLWQTGVLVKVALACVRCDRHVTWHIGRSVRPVWSGCPSPMAILVASVFVRYSSACL